MRSTQSKSSTYRAQVEALLSEAGLRINGDNPWDPQVHEGQFFKRILAGGSLALGESYMDGWWDCEQVDELFYRILRADLDRKAAQSWSVLWNSFKARIFNLQSPNGAERNVTHHYDIGNDLFERMLDERMVYSCGYWRHADNVDRAQEAKLRMCCEKLYLEPGMHVLDIGCGWGSFAKLAAEEYDVKVTGITLSDAQLEKGRAVCEGLPVELKKMDYRSLDRTYDRIISIGMFEHVGYKNYRSFFEASRRCLKDGGLMLLHTIGSAVTSKVSDPWISKYIFPNSLIPSMKQISEAREGLLILEDLHSFGPDYDKTLMAWHKNFVDHWDELKDTYGERFYRMWSYYLLCSAASFRARKNQLWQLVLSKKGLEGGYVSIRP